ncbi:MAG: hypothetical protein JWP03_2067, partial [Phycisphaerales bacterium]|nr:hypothetical protein [Phycisphaerales bacterium]
MKANNNDAAPLNLVFIQTNEYLRAADAKQLQITAAFLAIVSAVVTATADKGGQLLRPSGLGVVIYLLLLAAGFTAFVTLRWYRAWKVHYIGVLQQIVKAWDIDIESLPFIMRETEPINDKERRWWSIDDTFVYFIVFLNLALMAIAASTLLGWLSIEVPLTHQWALALAMVRPVGDYAQFT